MENSNNIAPEKHSIDTEKIKSYFYVFIDYINKQQEQNNNKEQVVFGTELDKLVFTTFQRFTKLHSHDARVFINPDRFKELRNAFVINTLPAFGLARKDISHRKSLGTKPLNLPSAINIFKRSERKKKIESGLVLELLLPRVERNIIESWAGSSDELYNFLRDLHIANKDHGLESVITKIEMKALQVGGKKVAKAVISLKTQYFG